MTTKLPVPLKLPNIYEYQDVRSYLRIATELIIDAGASYRDLAKWCGFPTPNFFQRVISGDQTLSLDSAKKISKAFKLNPIDTKYLLLLTKLDLPRFRDKTVLHTEINAMRSIKSKTKQKDTRIHEKWLHSVVFEMAKLKSLPLTVENISLRLGAGIKKAEIEESLKFLIQRKLLVQTSKPNVYEQAEIEFDPFYDRRSVDMISIHQQNLERAKHRLNDPVTETEFLGFTTALPFAIMPKIQKILRNAIDEIEHEIARHNTHDHVAIIEICAFKVTQ